MKEEIKKESRFISWFKKEFTVQTISMNALIASLYAVITMICGPLSYEFAQFRFSELLNLLVFFNPSYTLGLTIGCLIANLASISGIFDIIFGTLATLISSLLITLFSKYVKSLLLSGLIPCIINALMVPCIINLAMNNGNVNLSLLFYNYWIMFGWVFLGEFTCIICIGYPLFLILVKKSPYFNKLLVLKRNIDFKW